MTIATNKSQSAPPPSKGIPPQVETLQMMNAYRLSQNISVAAQLWIVDLLADWPRSVVELTQETKSHPQLLYRLLRTIASFNISAEVEEQKFRLTPQSFFTLDQYSWFCAGLCLRLWALSGTGRCRKIFYIASKRVMVAQTTLRI